MDKVENLEYWLAKFYLNLSIISQNIDIVCVEVLRPSQSNGVMSSTVSLLTIRLLGRLRPLSG